MKKIYSLIAAFILLPSFTWAESFSDVPLENGLYTPIEYLKDIEVLKGYEDGTFGISKTVNRAEALKIILVSSGAEINDTSDKEFGDVPKDAWFAPFVYHAANEEIVSGDGDTGLFAPAREVNRAEFLKMVLKSFEIDATAFTYEGINATDLPEDAWFTPTMKFAIKFEIIPFTNSEAKPSQPVTRGEAASIIFNTLDKGKGLQPQVLLDTMEQHVIAASEDINTGKSLGAALHIGKAEQIRGYLENLGQYFASVRESSAVETANKTVEAMRFMIGAFAAAEQGDIASVIDLSKKAWSAADAIPKKEGAPTKMETEIKGLASAMAAKAREAAPAE